MNGKTVTEYVNALETGNVALSSLLSSKDIPSIEVEVKDTTYNRRALRIFLPVVNSSAKVRILEQKHTTN